MSDTEPTPADANVTPGDLTPNSILTILPRQVPHRATGRKPTRGDGRALMFARYLGDVKLPRSTSFWKRRVPFPARTFGNTHHGCCTVASQALAAMRMERKEQARTINIATDVVLRTYYRMTEELYGGGDTGAYETDALSRWRRPDKTFHDTNGNALTIAAYTRVNHLNMEEIKAAIYVTGAMGLNGVKLCLNLPMGWASVNPPGVWDLPRTASGEVDRAALGEPNWRPYSWGGHSLFADEYRTVKGPDGKSRVEFRLVHSWYGPDNPDVPAKERTGTEDEQWISEQGMAAFCDEIHAVVDDADRWKSRLKAESLKGVDAKAFDVAGLVKDVNKVSPHQVGGARRQGRTISKSPTTAKSTGSNPRDVSER